MEKEALEHLENNAVGVAVLDSTGRRAVAIPQDYEIRNLEGFFDAPTRFRGVMSTNSLEDFIKYAKDYRQSYSAMFVDKGQMTAKLIVDFGSPSKPLHADHQARLELAATPAGRAILSANGENFGQQSFCEWLEDWRDYISVFDQDDDELSIVGAAAAVRRIDVSLSSKSEFEDNESSKKLSRSEQIEAKMKGRSPSSLRFTCSPYEGIEPVTYNVKINVLAGELPRIRLRISQMEVLQEKIAQEFKQKLLDGLPLLKAYIGSFKQL